MDRNMTRGQPTSYPSHLIATSACLTQKAFARGPCKQGQGANLSMVVGSGGCLLLRDDVDAVDDAGDVTAQLEQQRDQDLAAQALSYGDRHRWQEEGNQDFQGGHRAP